MKTIKNILIYISIFTLFGFQSISYSYTNNELDIALVELLSVKKGDVYKEIIDSFIDRKKDDKVILEKLESRLDYVINNLNSGKYDNSKEIVEIKAILNYFDIVVYFALQDLIVDIIEEIPEEEIIVEEEIEEEEETIEYELDPTLFPGFSDTYNEEEKTILAGEEVFVYKQSFSSLYEATEVGKAIFYITGPDVSNIKNTIEKSSLYLEGTFIDTVGSSKIDILSGTQAKITFDNLNDFIITQNIRQARLEIKTSNIGYEKLGKTIKDLYISKVGFDDIIGLSSGNKLNSYTVTEPGELFSIAPAVLEVSLEKNLSSSIPEINIRGLFGNNSNDSDNGVAKIELRKIKLSTLGSSTGSGVYYTLSNVDNSSDKIVGIVSGNYVEFDLLAMSTTNKTITNSTRGEDFRIYIYGTDSSSVVTLTLEKTGIIYEVIGNSLSNDLHISMEEELRLGSKNY